MHRLAADTHIVSLRQVHLVPSHWNFAEGQEVEVWAYFGHCASLELKLNGKSHGQDYYRFQPGQIAKFGNVTCRNGTLEVITISLCCCFCACACSGGMETYTRHGGNTEWMERTVRVSHHR